MHRINLNLGEEAAKNYYLELYSIFQKFLQNDADIQNFSNSFDWEKVNEVSEQSSKVRDEKLDQEKQDNEQIDEFLTDYVKNNKDPFEIEELSLDEKSIEQEARSIISSQEQLAELFGGFGQIDNDLEVLKSEIRAHRIEHNEQRIRDVVFGLHLSANKMLPSDNDLICDYYFEYNNRLYTLDMSRDFDSFGVNEDYYIDIYGDDFENMFYCELTEYHDYFEYSNKRKTMSFVYDNKKKKVLDITDISRYSLPNIDKPTVRTMNDDAKLAKVLFQ